MMNCNPETVSTDYDTSSRLYFEPITVEDVLNVIDQVRNDRLSVHAHTSLSVLMEGGGKLVVTCCRQLTGAESAATL